VAQALRREEFLGGSASGTAVVSQGQSQVGVRTYSILSGVGFSTIITILPRLKE